MKTNPVIEAMLNRKSIREYKDELPSEEILHTIVRAGMQAPFAAQLYSILYSRKKTNNPWGAPLLFVICIDLHKMQIIMAKRNWKMISSDLMMLLFGIQDAVLMAENMVMAAESLGLGSCFIGRSPSIADKIADEFNLPPRVFPIVELIMGYPAEDPPPRPRYPMESVLFEDKYPELTDDMIERAMTVMDEGFMAQNYYRGANRKLKLDDGREDKYTHDNYGWTEHISRKWGQWDQSPEKLLEQLSKRGFRLTEPGGWYNIPEKS